MQQKINHLLNSLQPEWLELIDESHLHIGHSGNKGGGHYVLRIVSTHFEGQSRIQRQRIINDLLSPLFLNREIHALSIQAKTPQEYFIH